MRTVTLVLGLLLVASSSPGQKLKHRDESAPESDQKCIDIRVFPEKGKLHYEYLTGDYPADGNLEWELGELYLRHPSGCRVNVYMDEAASLSDLKTVPILALEAGFLDLHVYVLWSHTGQYVLSKKNLMAEVSLVPTQGEGTEIIYGRVQRLPKAKIPKTSSAELKETERKSLAMLHFNVVPQRAEIKFDDQLVSSSPATFQEPKSYNVSIEQPGYRTWKRNFLMKEGDLFLINLNLEKQ